MIDHNQPQCWRDDPELISWVASITGDGHGMGDLDRPCRPDPDGNSCPACGMGHAEMMDRYYRDLS